MKKQIADIQLVKKNNLRIVLDCLQKSKVVSRADISKLTGLTRATVSSLVEELINKKFVLEKEIGKSNGGRKPILLSINSKTIFAIGIDISQENIVRGYLCNVKASVIKIAIERFDNEFDDICRAIKKIINILCKRVELSNGKILGIGVAVAGIVDPGEGKVLSSKNFDIEGTNLSDFLKKEFSLPVCIENESNAAALAELEYGNGQLLQNILYVSMGKGIGSGIIINRSIYYGGFYGAGEIGHIMVNDKGEKCGCGSKGCLETVGGYHKMIMHIKAETGKEMELDEIIDKYKKTDKKTVDIINMQALYLGKALAIASNLLNVEAIILGGYIVKFGSKFLDAVNEAFNEYSIDYYKGMRNLEYSRLQADAVGLGAASLILNKFWNIEETVKVWQ